MAASPPMPAPDDATIRVGVELLTWRAATFRREPTLRELELDDAWAEHLAGVGTETLAAAVATWRALIVATVTPDHAAALPQAPFRGPDAGPWHVAALRMLPARVALAGPDVVRRVLAGDVAAGLPDLEDVSEWEARFVHQVAYDAGVAWVIATRSRRSTARAIDDLMPSLDPVARMTAWWGSAAPEDAWRMDVGWWPLTVVDADEREQRLFMSASSPLVYTSRYASSPVDSRSARMRGGWLGALERVTADAIAQLECDVTGLTGRIGELMTLTVPTGQLTHRPLRAVELQVASGLRLGGLRGGRTPLPAPGRPYPDDDGDVARTVRTPTSVRVVVDLPARELPPLEDAACGVLRVFAHRLLCDLPDLTEHAREVLAAWRDDGPGGWGTPPFGLSDAVDDVVRFMREQGVELGP